MSGFSRYWYEYHLAAHGFLIAELTANGNWFSLFRQELIRWPSMARQARQLTFPLVMVAALCGLIYFAFARPKGKSEEIGCFGWQCVAIKKN